MKVSAQYINSLKMEIEYWIGENAKDNFSIIDAADNNDLWFHVDGQSSCHIIARMPDEKIDKKQLRQIITQGALLCKQNSKYVSINNLPIIYTKVENLEKTDKIGAVLTKETKTIVI